MKKYINTLKQEPAVFFVGLSVLLLAVMGTSVNHVSSTVFSLLVLLSFSVIKSWKETYLSLTSKERFFLITFFLYTVGGVFAFYNVDDVDQYYKMFERYLRFSLIIPVYLFCIKKNISVLNYLYVGAAISGPFLFAIALQQYLTYPDEPAKGYYHHIIFGQLAILNVGIMLSLLLTKKIGRKIQLIILFSMLCGIAAAVMSQARGVWLVFPIYAFIAMYYASRDNRISKKSIAIFLAVSLLLPVFTPIGDVIKQRTEAAISEVTKFYAEDQYVSSLGTRLAMWKVAVDVWKQHPLLGTGPGDFDDEIIVLQSAGEYSGMDIHNSTHNVYFQALVDSGLVGLAALLLVILIAPLKLFFGGNEINREGRLVGFVVVISYAVFGLSESWTLRSPAVSVYLVYMVIIASHIKVTCLKKGQSKI